MQTKTILIAVLAVIVVALTGVLGYQKLTQTKITPAVANQPIAQNQDEVAGWETYKNEQYGFEIKYPELWLSKEFISNPSQIFGIVFYEKEGLEKSVDVQIATYNETIDDFAKSAENVTSVERLLVDGYPAILLGNEGAMGGSLKIFRDGKIFGITCHYTAFKVWQEMFPTFKFEK